MMKSTYKPLSELELYKQCRKFRQTISILVREKFPKEEKYKLSDQILRASRSVTANIAEGHGRFYYQEGIRFCRISRGSLEETLEHLVTAMDENYIDREELKIYHTQYARCLKLLNGYIAYLKRSKRGEGEQGLDEGNGS